MASNAHSQLLLLDFLSSLPLSLLALDLKSGLAYEGKPKGGQPALTTYLIEAHDLVALLHGKLNTAHVRMLIFFPHSH